MHGFRIVKKNVKKLRLEVTVTLTVHPNVDAASSIDIAEEALSAMLCRKVSVVQVKVGQNLKLQVLGNILCSTER